MNKVYDYIKENKLEDEVRVLLQVHDELVFEIKSKQLAVHIPNLKHLMEDILDAKQSHGVPILIDVAIGKNWTELKDWEG